MSPLINLEVKINPPAFSGTFYSTNTTRGAEISQSCGLFNTRVKRNCQIGRLMVVSLVLSQSMLLLLLPRTMSPLQLGLALGVSLHRVTIWTVRAVVKNNTL